MVLDDGDDGDIAVLGFVDVVRCDREAAMPVADPGRDLALGVVDKAQVRRERRIDRLLHGHFDEPAAARDRAFVERRDGRGIKMNTAEKVDERGAGLDGRAVGKARDAHDTRHRLHREVHGQAVLVGARQTETRARGIDQPRIDRAQDRIAHAQLVHDARCEIFQDDVGLLHHFLEKFAATLRLEVERNGVLVGIQHGQRQRRALADGGAQTSGLAMRRFDLDDAGAGLGHQQRGIGPLINLAEVDDGHAGQRHIGTRTSDRSGSPKGGGAGGSRAGHVVNLD